MERRARSPAPGSGPELSRVYALLADAAGHYRESLHGSPVALSYLAARGIDPAVAARFALGFASPKWRDLWPVLERYDAVTIDASGLLTRSGEGAGARRFDRFRDRLMFPIRTRGDGAVAGFGGRVIEAAGGPKYLNSPEGVAFEKRKLLYGLFEAEAAIRSQGVAVVVEGFLDVVALAQAGCRPVVGTLGTACSREQLAELLALTSRVVFCFDGDAAGRQAAERAMEVALPFASNDRQLEFVMLPQGHDPDSFVRAHGLVRFERVLQGALSLTAFMVECASAGCDFRYAEGRARCTYRVGCLRRRLPDGAVRAELLRYCAGLLRMPEREVLQLWR